MAWSTSAPSLPSGQSWRNGVSVSCDTNWYRLSGTLQSARGYGNTYYLRLSVTYTSGPNGYLVPQLYLRPGGSDAGNAPSGGGTRTWYYTGSGTGSVDAGLSEQAGYFPSGASAHNTVSIPAKLTYAVTYNGNGADSGSTGPQTHTSGTPTAILANGFTRKSYTFVEWNTRADGTGTSYRPGDSYNANAALALYAIWVKANIPVYANVGGNLKQGEKAYANIGGSVKEVTVYANVGGVIKALI